MRRFLVIITTALLICSCTLFESFSKGAKVAQIGGAVLYKSDIEKIIPKGISSADSSVLVRQYVDSWAIRQLMLLKAEEQLPKGDKDVAQLLEDYRIQLLVFRYENMFVEERLDTLVSENERADYYNLHPDGFIGKNGLFKGRLIKMHNSSPNLQIVRRMVKSREIEDLDAVEALAYESAYKYSNYNNDWIDLNVVAREIGTTLGDLQIALGGKSVLDVEIKDSVYTNVLQVLDYIKPGEITPFEYNGEKIKEIIIGRRKQDLLLKLQSDILKDALDNKKLKIIEDDKAVQ